MVTYPAKCACGWEAEFTSRDVQMTHYNQRGDVIFLDEIRLTVDCSNPDCRPR